MGKKIKIIMGIMLIIIFIILFKIRYTIIDLSTDKTYLPYPNLISSNIRIDCNVQEDCKLVNVSYGCGGHLAINKINSQNNWDKYNNKVSANYDMAYSCLDPNKYKMPSKVICKNHICDINTTIPKQYLKYDGEDSEIRIDCFSDEDCEIVQMKFGCYGYASINTLTAPRVIKEYNTKMQKVYEEKGYEMQCAPNPPLEKLEPYCNGDFNSCNFRMISEANK